MHDRPARRHNGCRLQHVPNLRRWGFACAFYIALRRDEDGPEVGALDTRRTWLFLNNLLSPNRGRWKCTCTQLCARQQGFL